MTAWYAVSTLTEVERLVSAWSGAPVDVDMGDSLELTSMLLDIAMIQVWEFAPESFDALAENGARLPIPDDVPSRLVYAQLEQAKNLYNAGRAQQDGGVGTEGYSFIPRPLDKTIRSIIRPVSGVARVF